MSTNLITLTTDFGTADPYVAAMKGTILDLYPETTLVDISHEISPQDIMEAAFVLTHAVPYFPDNSVHLVVVDPGVGTDRRGVAVRINGRTFVGADNGLFSLLSPQDEGVEQAVELDQPDMWRTDDPSTTFHGRDIFAPVAAHLAQGTPLTEVGTSIDSLESLRWAQPIVDDQGIRGWIVHIDHFGNCITNISRDLLNEQRDDRPVKIYAGSTILEGIEPTYGAVAEGEPLATFGSSDLLEIAVNAGDAGQLLSIQKGDPVNLVFR